MICSNRTRFFFNRSSPQSVIILFHKGFLWKNVYSSSENHFLLTESFLFNIFFQLRKHIFQQKKSLFSKKSVFFLAFTFSNRRNHKITPFFKIFISFFLLSLSSLANLMKFSIDGHLEKTCFRISQKILRIFWRLFKFLYIFTTKLNIALAHQFTDWETSKNGEKIRFHVSLWQNHFLKTFPHYCFCHKPQCRICTHWYEIKYWVWRQNIFLKIQLWTLYYKAHIPSILKHFLLFVFGKTAHIWNSHKDLIVRFRFWRDNKSLTAPIHIQGKVNKIFAFIWIYGYDDIFRK